MAHTIRQSGGSCIVSIPKSILTALGLEVGSDVEFVIENDRVVIEPVYQELTLEQMLAGSPKGSLDLTDEDREWANMKLVGDELL